MRAQNAIGDPEKEDMSRWGIWDQLEAPEQWKWLTELGFYPRRGPVRASAEDLGVSRIGGVGESLPGTEIEEGIAERSKELIDRTKEPKLTVAEWSRLKRCERPCSKEERGPMPNSRKWKTLENLELSQQE